MLFISLTLGWFVSDRPVGQFLQPPFEYPYLKQQFLIFHAGADAVQLLAGKLGRRSARSLSD